MKSLLKFCILLCFVVAVVALARPLPPTLIGETTDGVVLFSDNFDSYEEMNLSGRCVGPGSEGCSSARFPWSESGAVPGYEFLWTGGGDSGSFPYVAAITSEGARGGSGKNVQMWDENQHELGSGQWGHDFQLAKYFPNEQHQEMWLQMWVYWTAPDIVTTNQKMVHLFHYDRDWLERPGSYFNTSNSTDGGTICNWREESDKMEFRCGIRCSNPGKYKCNARRSGVEFISPNGSSFSGRVPRFAVRTGANCSIPSDASYRGVFADGKWHKIEIGLRMNSAPGVRDGWMQVYFDDCRLGYLTKVAFLEGGAAPGITGFNGVSFGGNAQPNNWGPDGTDAKTWQVDDVKICTERCP